MMVLIFLYTVFYLQVQYDLFSFGASLVISSLFSLIPTEVITHNRLETSW